MSTVHAGMICIHLDSHHMALLAEHAEAANTPIQVCAGQLLRAVLEQRTGAPEHHPRLAELVADANVTMLDLRAQVLHAHQEIN